MYDYKNMEKFIVTDFWIYLNESDLEVPRLHAHRSMDDAGG
jgi:hypothetical protein